MELEIVEYVEVTEKYPKETHELVKPLADIFQTAVENVQKNGGKFNPTALTDSLMQHYMALGKAIEGAEKIPGEAKIDPVGVGMAVSSTVGNAVRSFLKGLVKTVA